MARILTLEDAVKVTKRFCIDNFHMDEWDDELDEMLESDLEQKVYIGKTEGFRTLTEGIMDITPAVIAQHIEDGTLKRWCQDWQVTMQMALIKNWKPDDRGLTMPGLMPAT